MHGCLGCTRHAQGGARALGCAAVRAKGGGEKGRAHLVLTPDSKPDSQGGEAGELESGTVGTVLMSTY